MVILLRHRQARTLKMRHVSRFIMYSYICNLDSMLHSILLYNIMKWLKLVKNYIFALDATAIFRENLLFM